MKKTCVFHQKMSQNGMKKTSQTKRAIEITKKTSPGSLWRSTAQFLVDFGSPRASQNGPKLTRDIDKNCFRSLLGSLWDHFGRRITHFLHFGSILASFSDPLGSILGPFWNKFSINSASKTAKQKDSKQAKQQVTLVRRNARSALNPPHPCGRVR